MYLKITSYIITLIIAFSLVSNTLRSATTPPSLPDHSWLFDDGAADPSSTTATAETGGNDGSFVNSPAWSSTTNFGYLGNRSIQIDANGEHIEMSGMNNVFDGSSEFTLSMWIFNQEATINNRSFFTTNDNIGSGQDTGGARLDSNGFESGNTDLFKFSLRLDTDGDNSPETPLDQFTYESTSNTSKSGVWQHVTMVWESGVGFKAYIDGNLDGDGSEDNDFPTSGQIQDQNKWIVGAGPKANFRGFYDEVASWNTALTQSEVEWLSQNSVRQLQSFSWEGDVDSDWGTGGNYSGGSVPGTGDVLNLASDVVGGNTTLDINGSNRSVGELAFNYDEAYLIEDSSGSDDTLVFDDGASGSGPPSGISVFSTFAIPSSTITHEVSANVELSNDATFSNVGNLTQLKVSGDIDLNNNELTLEGSSQIELSGAISGTSGQLTKGDSNTVILSGTSDNTFTGDTTISAGELQLNKSSDTDAISGDITINGGVVTYKNNNQIADSSTVNMSGGTLRLNGFNEGSPSKTGVNTLEVTADSDLDFSGISTFRFENDSWTAGELTINNWIGDLSGGTFNSTDMLLVNKDISSGSDLLNNIKFLGFGSAPAKVIDPDGNGVFEIVPDSSPVFQWEDDVDGDWNEGSKWSTDPDIPDDTGDVVQLVNITADRTITLTADRTFGNLSILEDTNNYTIADNGGSESLIVEQDTSGTDPGQIAVVNSGAHTIKTGITLNSDLRVVHKGTGDLTFSGDITNGSNGNSLTKSGAGTLVLSGNNDYTGSTTVNDGTLKASGKLYNNQNGGDLIINGGTLMLDNVDVLDNASSAPDVTFQSEGGTLAFGDTADADANGKVVLGDLTLQQNSIIDLGNGNMELDFTGSNISLNGNFLDFYNWSGSRGGGGLDQVFFSGNTFTEAERSNIRFFADNGTTFFIEDTIQVSSNGEVAPEMPPVPEASTWITASGLISIMLGHIFLRIRRQRHAARPE